MPAAWQMLCLRVLLRQGARGDVKGRLPGQRNTDKL